MLKSTEILNTINTKMETIKNLQGEEKKAVFEEIKNLKVDYEMELELENIEKETFENKVNKGEAQQIENKEQKKPEKVNIKNAFAKVVAGKETTSEERAVIKNIVIEGDPTKGGVAIPADVSTDIKTYQDTTRNFDIRPYITVEPVTTLTGSRPYSTNQPEASGFAPVDESKAIQEMYEPTFDKLAYTIQKYAGYIPVSNELLSDSTYGIYNYLVKWLGEGELNTYAYQVFNGVGTKSAQGLLTEVAKGATGILKDRITKMTTAPGVDDFKSIFNVDLETVSGDNIVIFTNADGYQYLDTLKDATKRYYMQPDPTKASGYAFLGKEIVKVPKKFLPTDATDGIPYIIGDLKQLYTLYDRQAMSVQSTNVGGDAWRTDTSELKGIFRFDGKIMPANIEAVKVLYAKF
ncbi:phage major capsid protein [Clostridium sp. BL-8]|uniref:phage major capsid protein n=1 Tax=Clostridium sp. BL-8 TaxID=349938 RepID=UPI00098BDA77|nr:phage major capsid protein [Clostridium sp. BL-8]OOM76581.1 phage capsid family protein [Clostridium sp. BL-8]